MFEDQNQKVDDIFSETDKTPAMTPEAPKPVAPLGPPSALSQGKLQPVQSSSLGSAVPSQQLSGSKSGFPFKKVLIISLVSLFLIGGASGAFYWWRNRSSEAPATPSLGAPVNTSQKEENTTPETSAENSGVVGDKLNEAYQNLNQNAVNSALDPLGASPTLPGATSGTTNNPAPDSSSLVDTDQDGLNDSQEFGLGTNPRLVDSDGDGLSDWEEVSIFGTEPLKIDTDGDSFPDGEEVQNGYNPKGSGKLLDFEKAKSLINQ